MSMTLASRKELYKLREIVHFLLRGAGATRREQNEDTAHGPVLLCWFCRKPLDDGSDFVKHGNAYGPKFAAKLSIHHIDNDHDNNNMTNKALSHTYCHKAHHRREANLKRASAKESGDGKNI